MRPYRRPWLFAVFVLVAAVCVLITLAAAQQVAPSSLAASPAALAAQPRAPAAGTREAQAAAPAPPPPRIDSGDTAWMLTSTALVLMMTAPGLALFYGGMVRRQNVLGTIMQSFIIMALVSIQWVLWGYSLAFGPDIRGLIGSLDWFGLKGVGLEPFPEYAGTIPHQAFMIYQLMFAIITPASGFVGPLSAVLIGAVAGNLCYNACNLKTKIGYDDSLDVVGVHGVGGTWGALATGLFASKAVNEAGNNGLFFGNPDLFRVQAIGVLATWIFAFVGSLILLKIVDALIGLRVHEEDEVMGLDLSQHNESAYALGMVGTTGFGAGLGALEPRPVLAHKPVGAAPGED